MYIVLLYIARTALLIGLVTKAIHAFPSPTSTFHLLRLPAPKIPCSLSLSAMLVVQSLLPPITMRSDKTRILHGTAPRPFLKKCRHCIAIDVRMLRPVELVTLMGSLCSRSPNCADPAYLAKRRPANWSRFGSCDVDILLFTGMSRHVDGEARRLWVRE